MKLRSKAIAAFVGVVLITGTTTLISTFAFINSQKDHEIVQTVDKMVYSVVQVQQFLTDVSATHDAEGYTDAKTNADQFHQSVERLRQLEPENAATLNTIAESFSYFYDMGKKMAGAYVSEGIDAGNKLMKGTDQAKGFDQYSEDLDDRLRLLQQSVIDRAKKNKASSERWILLTSLLALASAIAIANIFSGYLARGIRQLQHSAGQIAAGELDHSISFNSNDELGDMAQTFTRMVGYLKGVANLAETISQGDFTQRVIPQSDRDQFGVAISRMSQRLREVVGDVGLAAHSVGAGSTQLKSAGSQLTEAVTLQASITEETSAAIAVMATSIKSVDANSLTLGSQVVLLRNRSDELAKAVDLTSSSISELAASIQHVALNVSHANEVSEKTSEAANDGEKAVEKMTSGMRVISETMTSIHETIQTLAARSGEIGAIVEVIDDIAEQTNLLALNAAIEAARAGESGRGFAVVADEVRKLAERSAKATREIDDLIKGIQRETAQAVGITQQGAATVEEGVLLAGHTGDSLKRIKEGTSEVKTLLNGVSSATNEQATSSTQIVTAAQEMATINQRVTQAVAEMDRIVHTVTHATQEQAQGVEQVIKAVEHLSASAQNLFSVTDQVASVATDLNGQATGLSQTMAFFKVDESPAASLLLPQAAETSRRKPRKPVG